MLVASRSVYRWSPVSKGGMAKKEDEARHARRGNELLRVPGHKQTSYPQYVDRRGGYAGGEELRRGAIGWR